MSIASWDAFNEETGRPGPAGRLCLPPPKPEIASSIWRRPAITSWGYAAKATPIPDGKAVIYLRAGARDATQHLYEYDIASGHERELVTPEMLLGGATEVLSVEEKARRERARITAKGFSRIPTDR